ncbi:hypothetical protein CEY09_30340 [Achromobacter marplatensis]|uniref:Uncharacterized protein n=1 Tax=Achromobacter marplatensis TaxID=470868 RepID=A0ABX9FW90_9BURK|nr:hypothetical protein [Achromobacter marplatensis]OWT55589.1 hypothetical protein CEY09_30340 [Achromobacter marplatensis]RBP11250.1 hypothetical protein DFP87_12311 [Achromobacter marplatensis]CAB3712562.1 hypothetical protein LMG26219_06012 [Achromobacter marplatensis]
MTPLLRAVLPYLIGAALVVSAVLGVRWYGSSQYQAGADAKQAEIEKRQAAIERAWQEERDRADAKHRGAVLAREAAEKTVAAQRGRIDGLLRQLAQRRAEAASDSGGRDATGPDWIGIIGSCVGRYEQLGKEAARWADQVNGLQGYIKALQARHQ